MKRIYTFERDKETVNGFLSSHSESTDAMNAIGSAIDGKAGWDREELTQHDDPNPRIAVTWPDHEGVEDIKPQFEAALRRLGVNVKSIE